MGNLREDSALVRSFKRLQKWTYPLLANAGVKTRSLVLTNITPTLLRYLQCNICYGRSLRWKCSVRSIWPDDFL